MYAYSYTDGICAHYPIKLPFCQALFPDSLLDGPAVCGDIHPVAFRVAYPTLCHGPKGVGFCLGLRCLFDRWHILHLETEVVDPPGQFWPADQRNAHETIGQVDGAVGTPVFFLQTEHACIVLGECL